MMFEWRRSISLLGNLQQRVKDHMIYEIRARLQSHIRELHIRGVNATWRKKRFVTTAQ